ncbi:hypothetical protein SLS53_004082 [Cytospora paraplurivora]|uniref:Uncharacterized protein n=1 Tax=Cytospora paraplurivora TaxID=2898453 RepID=A0AAN9U9Q4_9PEZI
MVTLLRAAARDALSRSYGALKAVPTTKNPGPEPSNGEVIGIAMMATGFNLPNMAFMDGLGGQPPPTWRADTESGFAVFTDNPSWAGLFYHDLSAPETEEWFLKLTNQNLKAFFEGGEYAYAGRNTSQKTRKKKEKNLNADGGQSDSTNAEAIA